MDLTDAMKKAGQILDEERLKPTVRYEGTPSYAAFAAAASYHPPLDVTSSLHLQVDENPGQSKFRSINYDLLCAILDQIRAQDRPQLFGSVRSRILGGESFHHKPGPVLTAGSSKQCSSELPLVCELCVRRGDKQPFLRTVGNAFPSPGLTLLLMQLQKMIAFDFTLFSDQEYTQLSSAITRIGQTVLDLKEKPKPASTIEANTRHYVLEEAPQLCDSVIEVCRKARYLYAKGALISKGEMVSGEMVSGPVSSPPLAPAIKPGTAPIPAAHLEVRSMPEPMRAPKTFSLRGPYPATLEGVYEEMQFWIERDRQLHIGAPPSGNDTEASYEYEPGNIEHRLDRLRHLERMFRHQETVSGLAGKPFEMTIARDSGVPTAFMSYSWDTAKHKQWVLHLAERLRSEGGVNVILDHWHLPVGGDRTYFMENNIRRSDFVLLVCTPIYAQKSNARSGGVGYEATVITGQLAQHITQNKFIPVLRVGEWDDSAIPIWLQTKIGVDFRNEPYSEVQYQLLLRALHQAQEQAPPIGPKPNFQAPTGVQTDGLLGNAVTAVFESVSTGPEPAQSGVNAVTPSRSRQSPEAYAFYEKQGADARVQVFVRPVDLSADLYSFETSTGEYEEGPRRQIDLRYLGCDRDLKESGYTRMQSFNGTSGQRFNLP